MQWGVSTVASPGVRGQLCPVSRGSSVLFDMVSATSEASVFCSVTGAGLWKGPRNKRARP